MATFHGIIGTQVAVTGNTTLVIGNAILKKSNTTFWERGCFGISVTQMGTEEFHVSIVGDIQGTDIPVAGLSGIVTTSSTLIPIVNERIVATVAGTTQFSVIGIALPRRIVFGNSAIVGQTYSAVISASLYSGK